MSQRVGRQPLHAPKAPKGGDIEAMLKFVREQKEKPSEAAANAKKLKQLSNDSKKREKHAASSKAFMDLFRSLAQQAEIAQNMSTSSMVNLSSLLPELPSILKIDASLQAAREKDHAKCDNFKERQESILIRSRTRQTAEMFNAVKSESEEYLKTLELPEEYDRLVEIVESTKIPPPAPASYDFSDLNDEWRSKAEETVAVFATAEKQIESDYEKWQKSNGYDPSIPFGGWDQFEHQRFVLTGGNSEVEFGSKSPHEIARHQAWTIRTKFLTKKKDALRVELRKRVTQIRSDAREAARLALEKEAEEAALSARRAEFAEQKGVLESRLEAERKERAEREAVRAAREAEEKKRQEEEEQLIKQQKLKEAKQLKQKVMTEKDKKAQRDALIAKKKLEQEKREKELEKLRQKKRVAVVEKRQELVAEKSKARAAKMAEIQKIKDERERRLAILAQSVIDEFGLDEVEADPTRLTKINEMRRKMPKEEKPMFVATSFPSSVIEADPRIRVENALREAGLMNSPYAQQVIYQMSALKPAPPSAESHINLS